MIKKSKKSMLIDNMFKVSGVDEDCRNWLASVLIDMKNRYRDMTISHVEILEKKYIDILISNIKNVYMFFLTEDDISQIIKFYSSPSLTTATSKKVKLKIQDEISSLASAILDDFNSILNGDKNG